MRKNLVIISAGALGREVFGWATDAISDGAGWRVKGFLDGKPDALDGYGIDLPVLGSVDEYRVESEDLFVVAVADPQTKVKCIKPILDRGGTFVSVIHPLAKRGRNIELGIGSVLAPFSVLDCDLRVGNFVTVLPFSTFGHDVNVGDWCQVSSHCGVNGRATLGQGVFLGSHACIIPRVRVGDWAYVGAGSVVITEVHAGTKVFGNPARPVNMGQQVDSAER
jgi:sugar O-acyltransferase (sialic acid O-acetyltransferase NeuD family)